MSNFPPGRQSYRGLAAVFPRQSRSVRRDYQDGFIVQLCIRTHIWHSIVIVESVGRGVLDVDANPLEGVRYIPIRFQIFDRLTDSFNFIVAKVTVPMNGQ